LPAVDSSLSAQGIAHDLASAVREAGALALGKFRTQVRNWTKGNNSPVSEADIEVDRFLRQRLGALASGYAWLSEESEDDLARLDAERVWIVDPIDGTRAFIAGHSDWSIAAALAERGRPVAAAIYAPVAGELFVAAKGAGARLNGRPLSVSEDSRLAAARVAGPKSYLDAFAALEPAIERLPKVHSLALRMARVSAGLIDVAFASTNSHDWDLAAADLIVHEAGGVLTHFDGEAPVYNRRNPQHQPLVAASRGRHAAFMMLRRGRTGVFA
jgi:myo-inositol-1(or 4)-monophosphatase